MLKSGKEFAPGIKRQDFPGNISKIKPEQVLDYVVQRHAAHRRGLHYDLRIGNRPMGMFSWAANEPPTEIDKDKQRVIRTNLHSSKYNDFEGEIPRPLYGAGFVSTHAKGKVLITHTTPNSIHYTLADKKHPVRYALVRPGQHFDKEWLLIKASLPEATGAEKPKYKSIPKEHLLEALKHLKPEDEVQPKVDGALHFVNIARHKPEILSHRVSKTTGKPVLQTERFYGSVPHIDFPRELNNSVLLAEVYGEKNGKPIPNQALSGLLNSSVGKALTDLKDRNITLKGVLFDIAKKQNHPIDVNEMSYKERKALLNQFMKYLPKGKFTVSEGTSDPKAAKKMVDQIASGKHPLTEEGVVIHKEHGAPQKYKLTEESDVYINGVFPAEKGSKYENKGIGGFTYSLTPGGHTVGKIGTGLIDSLRHDAHKDPDKYIGRIAVIHSLGQFDKSKAHRNPALLRIHSDYDINNPPRD